jgi:hypothetical protein
MTRVLPLLAAAGVTLAQTSPAQQGDDTQLWTCGASPGRQEWILETQSTNPLGHHIVLAGSRNESVAPNAWLVMDIAGWSNSSGAEVHVWFNTTGPNGFNEQWLYNSSTGQIVSTMSHLCAAASAVLSGMPVRMATCSAAGSALDSFDFDSATGLFHLRADPTLCLDAGTSASCSQAPYNTFLYCDPDASVDDRIADLIPRLTAPDYQALLDNANPGIPRLGIPKIQFGECLHGPLTGCGAPYTDPTTGYTSTGCPTSLPHSLLQGGTFNRTLWSLVGSTISTEVRALHNQGGIAASILWAPDINEVRERGRGRGRGQGAMRFDQEGGSGFETGSLSSPPPPLPPPLPRGPSPPPTNAVPRPPLGPRPGSARGGPIPDLRMGLPLLQRPAGRRGPPVHQGRIHSGESLEARPRSDLPAPSSHPT